MKTQKEMFYAAGRKIAEGNDTFMDIMRGPNPLSREDVDRLIARNPYWSRFAGFGTKGKVKNSTT